MTGTAIDALADTDRYPFADPGGPRWQQLIARVRAELRASGCSVLRDFIAPRHRERLRGECAEIEGQAYYREEPVNAYNTAIDDPALPLDHPAKVTMSRGNAFVPRDVIPTGHLIHRLYIDPLFQRLVAECFGMERIYPLADPLSGLVLNVIPPGRAHPWHFDTNEFTVSLLTTEPDAGGVFEYCPAIRSASAENLEDVAGVLDGRREHLVRRLPSRPGDLQLFAGRYSLHRVSEVTGTTARHTAIFAYSERPDVVGSVARTRQLFGRVSPQHLAADNATRQVDQLLI
jgi:hypothetical protein